MSRTILFALLATTSIRSVAHADDATDLRERWTDRRVTVGVTGSLGDSANIYGAELDLAPEPWVYLSTMIGTANFNTLAVGTGLHLRHQVTPLIALSIGGGLSYTGPNHIHDETEKNEGGFFSAETNVTDTSYPALSWASAEVAFEARDRRGITARITVGLRQNIKGSGAYTCTQYTRDFFNDVSQGPSCNGNVTVEPYVGIMVGKSL